MLKGAKTPLLVGVSVIIFALIYRVAKYTLCDVKSSVRYCALLELVAKIFFALSYFAFSK
jgi:hypothetical protein